MLPVRVTQLILCSIRRPQQLLGLPRMPAVGFHLKIAKEHVKEAVGAVLAAATAMLCVPRSVIAVQTLMIYVMLLHYRPLSQLVKENARLRTVVVCLLLVPAGVIASACTSTTAATTSTLLSSARHQLGRVMALAVVSLALIAGATAIARCMVIAVRITRVFVLLHVLLAQLAKRGPSD